MSACRLRLLSESRELSENESYEVGPFRRGDGEGGHGLESLDMWIGIHGGSMGSRKKSPKIDVVFF